MFLGSLTRLGLDQFYYERNTRNPPIIDTEICLRSNAGWTIEIACFIGSSKRRRLVMLMRDFIKDQIEPIEIDNFFAADLCQQCIDSAELGSWRQSNYGSRKIQHTNLEQTWLEDKLRAHVPERILDWEYFGIHKATCQFFKYTENDTFPDHQDQAIVWAPDVQSLLTLVVYLNRCEGGATGFPERRQSIEPSTGKAVIFPQNLLHNSARIEGGLKYILRAQILYKNCGSLPY
jgi:hypothetical protein